MAAGPSPNDPFAAGPPPAARPAPGAPRQPSLLGLWIGVAVLVLGIGGAAIWLFSAVLGLGNRVDSLPRYGVPVDTTMTLTAGDYYVYAEYPGANLDPGPASGLGAIQVTDANRQILPISTSNISETYSFGSREGRLVGRFTAAQDGSYTLTTPDAAPTSGQNIDLTVSKGSVVLSSQVLTAVCSGRWAWAR